MENNGRDVWSTWLKSQHWDYFVTITTRKPRRDRLALLRDVKRALLECGYCRGYVAIEPFSGEGIHAHGLVATHSEANNSNTTGMLPWQAWSYLFRRFGRCQVSRVRSMAEVSAYCAKYVTKRAGEYDYYDYYAWARARGVDRLTDWLRDSLTKLI